MSEGTGDKVTNERAKAGVKPDLIGWKAIADALGVSVRTAMKWERGGMPVTNWGPKTIAGYRDRLMAWAASPRRRAA